jgi:propionate CoA-transferase
VRILTAHDAVQLIPDGATVAISGGGYRVVPEALLEALSQVSRAGTGPTGLTAIAIAWLERARGGRGGDGTGLNLLAVPNLLDRIITSSYSRSRTSEMGAAIRADQLAAFNYPMGTMVQWMRAIAAGRSGLLTTVGLGTFVDPRVEGGVVNARAGKPLNRVVMVKGEEHLYYPALPVQVALVKASAVDPRGNLFFDNEAFDHGVQELAMASRRHRGLVIAQVNRLVEYGELHPRFARVPGPLVDVVVVQPETWEDEQDPLLTGRDYSDLPSPGVGMEPRHAIARTVVELLPKNAMVNLGAGIPMYDVPEAARGLGRDDIYFTVEQGPMDGWPKAGGVSRHPGMIMPQLDVFDFYEGGGPDVSVLAFGEVGRNGDVNVSRFGDMMPGCGDFPNIVHGIKKLFFCGTLTTGGLDETIRQGTVDIRVEGRIDRFVQKVSQVTFNAQRALAAGHEVVVVTDRCILELRADGFEVVRIFPGVDLDLDVLAHIPFPVRTRPGNRADPLPVTEPVHLK